MLWQMSSVITSYNLDKKYRKSDDNKSSELKSISDSLKFNSKNLQNGRKSVHTQREGCLAMTNIIYDHQQ